MIKRIRWWWRQPDHYAWFGSYLEARRMAGMTRAVVALIAGSLAVLILALSAAGAGEGVSHIVVSGLAVTGGLACSLLWIVRWPSKVESIVFVVTADASIAVAALVQRDVTIALLACTAFATMSAYVAIFHSAPLMVANATVAIVVPIVPTLAMASTVGVVPALCGYVLVVVVNISAPFGIQLLIHALGIDLLKADRDPLTGLLNRRAFYERAGLLVGAHRHSDKRLVVAMIDLDRFKRLNDTKGHAAGDRALIAVGHALREHTRPSAIVGRVGGEEFLVADVFADPVQADLGQRLCEAIATLPYGITASVGSASARCDHVVGQPALNVALTALIGSADAAMYDAKRNGGNQSRWRVSSLDEYSR